MASGEFFLQLTQPKAFVGVLDPADTMKPHFSNAPKLRILYSGSMSFRFQPSWMLAVAVAALSSAASQPSRADETPVEDKNPYQGISRRNPFGIKPPEPEAPAPPAPVAPPAPPSNVFLTGIIDLGDGKQAFFSVSKPTDKVPEFLSLKEGETQGDLTVLSIDPAGETVRIRNAGNETALDFKNNSLKSVVAAPGVPPPPGSAPNAVPVPAQNPQFNPRGGAAAVPGAGGGPVVVGRRGEVQQPVVPTVTLDNSAGAAGSAVNYSPSTPQPIRELPTRRSRIEPYVGGGIGAGQGTTTGSAPEGVKVVPPPNYLPPLPRSP
jgi:hypothetical protein